MRDHDPEVISAHMVLGDQVMRLDQLETRVWMQRNRGLYIGPESSHQIAFDVLVEILAIRTEGRP